MKKIYPKLSFAGMALLAICATSNAQNIKPIIPNQDQVVYNGSYPSNYDDDTAQTSFTVYKGIYYFAATADDSHVKYLWRSDGTAAGTYVFTNKATGVYNVDTLNGTLFIVSQSGVFVSNGTDAGTHKISGNSSGVSSNFVNFQSRVFYGNSGTLYKTDGTQGGTFVVNELGRPGFFKLLPLKNILLFSNFTKDSIYNFYFDGVGADTGKLGYEPNSTLLGDSVYYSSHGTLYTYSQDILDASSPGSLAANPGNAVIGAAFATRPFAVINGVLYFAAATPATGTELYKYDPLSGAGITLVKDIMPGADGSAINNNNMLVISSTLYFTAVGSDGSSELWKTDGTEAGTVLVKAVEAGIPTTFSDFANVNGSLFFSLYSTANGAELWSSDGTDGGTVLVKQIHAGEWRSSLGYITSAGAGSILFTANDGPNTHGAELWFSDGTNAGTALLKDINLTNVHSLRVLVEPNEPVALNNYVIFRGTDTTHGDELWSTNGTLAGTDIIKDIIPGTTGSNPQSFFVVNGGASAYFTAGLNDHRNLWRTDGTAAGTVVVKYFDSTGYQPGIIVGTFKNLVFFTVDNGTFNELWNTDGTGAGTKWVRDLNYIGDEPFLFAGGTKSYYFCDQYSYISYEGDKDGGHTAYNSDTWQVDGTTGAVVLVNHSTGIVNGLFLTLGNTLVFSPNGIVSIFNSSGLKNVGYGYGAGATVINNMVYASVYNQVPFYFEAKIDSNGHVDLVQPGFTATVSYNNLVDLHDGKLYASDGTKLEVSNEADSTLTFISKSYNITTVAKGYGKLYFRALSAGSATIGTSDGTDAGTSLITDTILPFTGMGYLMFVNHHVVFTASTTFGGQYQLYGLQVSDALPVKLSAFTGKLVNGNGVLNWSTASELNSSYFGIERSTDGMQFNSIGTVRAAGNASFTNNYTYTDYNVVKLGAPNLYYRLKPVDKDGKFTYSNTVLLHPYLDFTASASPVPVANRLSVNITSAKTQTVQLIVTDVNGKVLLTGKKAIDIGSTTLQYNTGAWAAGVYLVQLTQADGTRQTIKVVKQ